MSTAPFVAARRLSVDRELRDFVENELLPDLGIEPARYWSGLQALIEELTPANRALLAIRDELQAKIDAWHRKRRGTPWDADAYRSFLEEIGYLEPRGPTFRIETENVDPEIAAIAGPQLVVPASNARLALNATNARWGSLYDALYGTDVISEAGGCERGVAYNPVRGKAVIAFAATFLDRAVPLVLGSHGSVVSYRVVSEGGRTRLEVVLDDGTTTGLSDPGQFAGYESEGDAKSTSPLQPWPAHRDLHRSRACGGPGVGRRRQRRRARVRGHDDPGPGGLRGRSRCRGQGAGLPQLAGPDARHANGDVRQERTRTHTAAGVRPALHEPHRRYAGAAGPEPPAGAKCRASHDHAGRPGSRRVRSLRRDSRCRHHRDLRAVRPARARRDRQQPDRQHLHRETQDARLARGRICRSSVCRCRGPAWPFPLHLEDRVDG